MPLIPLPRSNVIAAPPPAALDTLRRPTVDKSAVQQGVALVGRAAQQPLLPANLGAAPYEALGAVGKAVAQGGDVIGAAAILRRKAESDVQVAEADKRMDLEQGDFAKWRGENPDPQGWDAEWARRATQVRDEINSNDKLHDGAREQINLRLTRWEGVSAHEVAAVATKQTFSLARDATLGRLENAVQKQDRGQFEANLNSPYLHEHEKEGLKIYFDKVGERQKKEADAEVERARYETGAAEAIADPRKWIEDNAKPWKDDPITWQRVKNVADGRINEGTAEIVGQVNDMIASEAVKTPKEIDAIESPLLTPALRDQAKRFLASHDRFAEQVDKEQNGVENAVRLRKEVMAYDPHMDPDRSNYFGILHDIGASVEQSQQGEITGELYKKYGMAPPPGLKVRPEIQRDVSKQLDSLFSARQGAIPWEHQVTVKEAGKKKVEWQTDQEAKRRAIDAQTIIEMKMSDWFKENPDATLNDAKKKLNDFLPEGTRAGALDAMQKLRKPQASVDSVRKFQDAPDLAQRLPAGLKGHAQDFIDAGREYGLNPRVLAAISALETGGGTSKAFREKNNAMGISNESGPIALPSVRESIFRQAKTLAMAGGPYAHAHTIDEIGAIYAPPGASNDPRGTNSGWSEGVRAYLARL